MTTTLKTIFVSTLAYFIGGAVLLSSVHAKDLASQQTDLNRTAATAKIYANEVSTKVFGELHPHVDKTSLKSPAKTVGEKTVFSDERRVLSSRNRYKRTLATKMLEASLMMRLMYARVLVG